MQSPKSIIFYFGQTEWDIQISIIDPAVKAIICLLKRPFQE
jgi:hypothetical protein